ncbi:MICOS complex subunit MIC27 isoform X2 [Channa argus]|uniref:MICOS complex subunit MIC27 isoform X2 n=1 Tax=Channa argus TaxID=215402 RepID=UPI00352050F4
MAAKVVMVAVPTVLGIASIRVYTVSEVPADGLAMREKLNIYTPPPPPQSAQVQFVPEKPGVIESGLSTARESIVPIFQAVKGACVSVKRGSVNLYHAGEDVFFYLKDPPPGFLPRFSTITMAGLLGMVLARKGSRFKQVAVPLGLMGAGASVCYPAQAVAVFKISSGSTPVSSAQSTTVPEPEMESAESVPDADEPIVVSKEEESSVTLENAAPTESNTVVHSVPSETDTTTTARELPALAESEDPSGLAQAPVKSLPSLEEPPVPEASFLVPAPTVPSVESAEAEAADQPPVAAVEETLTSSSPPSEGPAGQKSKGGSSFKPDSSLMDFGQSSPEDEDLYSTRS